MNRPQRVFSSPRRSHVLLALVLLLVGSGCSSTYVRERSAPPLQTTPEQVVYLVGDFGAESDVFHDVVDAIATELYEDEHRRGSGDSPFLLSTGDNLYSTGLPPHATAETPETVELARLVEAWNRCVYSGRPVPFVLIPGNHDHDNDALRTTRETGEIAGWFELPRLVDAPHWVPVPGSIPDDVADVPSHIREARRDPAEFARLFAPERIPFAGRAVGIVAIDSQLLIDLYRRGHDEAAAEYLTALRRELRSIHGDAWRGVVAHHPIATYGKHRPAYGARWLFGPGWPQFPETGHRFTGFPPVGTLITFAWWVRHHPQNFHSGPYTRYAEALTELLEQEGVSVFLAGHDHSLQLIDLGRIHPMERPSIPNIGVAPHSPRPLVVVSGAGTWVDPVSRGRGTLAHHTGGGFVRLAFHRRHLEIELIDRHGERVYRHRLGREQ